MTVKRLMIFYMIAQGLLSLGLRAYAIANEITDARFGGDKVETFNYYFVTVGNFQDQASTNSYTKITVIAKNGLPNARPTSKSYQFPDHIVSQACGNHISRCRELTVIQQGSTQIFLLPFTRAIGMMKLEDTGGRLLYRGTYVLEYTHHPDCTTLAIIEFNGKPYLICVNSANRLISCSVNIDSLNLTQSYLQCSSLGDHSLDITNADFSFISNFVNTENDFFVFAVNNLLYKYYPERTALRLIPPHCGLPHTEPNTQLVFNEENTLLIYYTIDEDSIVIPFDTDEECWQYSYTNNHLEYPCFNGFSVFVYPSNSAIVYKRRDLEEGNREVQIGIVGTHFVTGKCFGNLSLAHFVYRDRVNGTVLLEISSQQNVIISNSTLYEDQVPVVYQNRYLAIRDKNGIQVIDVQSFKPVIETHLDTDPVKLTGFFTGAMYETSFNKTTEGNKMSKQGLLPSIATGVIGVCLLITIGSIGVLIRYRVYQHRAMKRTLNRPGQNGGTSPHVYQAVHRDQNNNQGSEGDQSDHQPVDTVVTTQREDSEVDIQTRLNSNHNDQDGNTANEDTDIRRSPSLVVSLGSATLESPSANRISVSHSNSNSSLYELYPERGSLPHTVVQLEAQSTLSTTSFTTSLTTSVQDISGREQYVPAGASASNENLSMLSPVQVSQQQSNVTLKYDCNSVLTTNITGAVENEQCVRESVTDTNPQDPDISTSLDPSVTTAAAERIHWC